MLPSTSTTKRTRTKRRRHFLGGDRSPRPPHKIFKSALRRYFFMWDFATMFCMPNFWTQLSKPFFALAPMADVTDFAFREMFAKYSSPNRRIYSDDEGTMESGGRSEATVGGKNLFGFSTPNSFVMYTEFVNVDGLLHPEGYKRLSIDLKYSEAQRPIVAQIWGRDPEKFYRAAQLIASLGFNGIDVNFGCPQDKEIGQGTCAALILEPELAKAIILSTMKGAGGLPVSIKTRLGYSKPEEVEGWLKHLLETKPAAIAIHARTKQEKSKVPAHWEKISDAVKLRNALKSETLIIGNGDVQSLADGLQRSKETGCDGVMIGRGVFGNPWFFRAHDHQPTTKERLKVMLEHAALFEKEFAGVKSFLTMRKHFKAYVSGFEGAAELRAKLMETKNLEETKMLIEEFMAGKVSPG